MPRALKSKISINEHIKGKKDREKFGYKIPNNSREELLLDKKNGNNLWADEISKKMTALERLGVFQFYPEKTNFEKKDGWKYTPMHIIFDVKQQDLQQKDRLVVGRHVVDSTEYTKYSSTIKYVSMRLMILIAVNNGLGIMYGDIGNALCMDLCAENIWSFCGAEFGPRCGAVVVPKQSLYGLKTASKSFYKCFGYFFRDLGFAPSIAYQHLGIWLHWNTCGWCHHRC